LDEGRQPAARLQQRLMINVIGRSVIRQIQELLIKRKQILDWNSKERRKSSTSSSGGILKEFGQLGRMLRAEYNALSGIRIIPDILFIRIQQLNQTNDKISDVLGTLVPGLKSRGQNSDEGSSIVSDDLDVRENDGTLFGEQQRRVLRLRQWLEVILKDGTESVEISFLRQIEILDEDFSLC